MSGFFKNFLNSFIVSMLFGLAGMCFFVGDFPPTIPKVKKAYNDYKYLLQYKELISKESGNMDPEVFSGELQIGMQKAKRNFASVPKSIGAERVSGEPTPGGLETSTWREELYKLQVEIFRLNQRVIELEKQKKP